MVETIQEPLLVLDAELGVRGANAAFYRMFRLPRKTAESRAFLDLGEGRWDVPAVRSLLEEVLRGDAPREGREVEMTFPGIGSRTIALNARRLVQEETTGDLILVAIRDITESKRALDELRASEERFRAVVQTAVDGIISVDRRGAIVSFNPAAERIFRVRRVRGASDAAREPGAGEPRSVARSRIVGPLP